MFTKKDTLSAAKMVKLSKKEQNILLERIMKGEQDYITGEIKKDAIVAMERLKRECIPLILSVVEKYSNSGLPLTELIKLGESGFNNGIEKWNTRKKRNYPFTYYAAWFIRAEIHKKLGLPTDVEGYGELRKKK